MKLTPPETEPRDVPEDRAPKRDASAVTATVAALKEAGFDAPPDLKPARTRHASAPAPAPAPSTRTDAAGGSGKTGA